MTSFDQAPPPRPSGTTGDLCEALNQHQRHLSEEHGPTNTQHGNKKKKKKIQIVFQDSGSPKE